MQGKKNDQEKLRTDLLPPDVLECAATILTDGANKYGDRNWENGMKWSRPYGALLRHVFAWWQGEDLDPESGHSHLWHALCCVMFLTAYENRDVGEDDRPDINITAESTETDHKDTNTRPKNGVSRKQLDHACREIAFKMRKNERNSSITNHLNLNKTTKNDILLTLSDGTKIIPNLQCYNCEHIHARKSLIIQDSLGHPCCRKCNSFLKFTKA